MQVHAPQPSTFSTFLQLGNPVVMGLVVEPVLGGMALSQRAEVFKHLIPKMTFLMPMLSGVTTMAGVTLAERLGMFTLESPWIVAALLITAVLLIQWVRRAAAERDSDFQEAPLRDAGRRPDREACASSS